MTTANHEHVAKITKQSHGKINKLERVNQKIYYGRVEIFWRHGKLDAMVRIHGIHGNPLKKLALEMLGSMGGTG